MESFQVKQNKLPNIVDLDENLNREILKYFKGEKDGYVQVGPKKWFLPMKYKKLAQDLIDFEVRPDDVWIVGIPRSGTTLTQELTWQLIHDLNVEEAEKTSSVRVPFFESSIVLNEKTFSERFKDHPDDEDLPHFMKMMNNLKTINEMKTRRVIKTHLSFELLPPDIFSKGCKVIYVCRYPKDVAFSYFSLQSKSWHIDFRGDFQTYWNFFRNGNCMFGPYFEHVKQAFALKDHKNVLFLFFENFKQNSRQFIKNLAAFLEKPLPQENLSKLEEIIEFDNFKKISYKFVAKDKNNEKVEIVRKGEVGGWRNQFTQEMDLQANEWIDKNIKEIGISFPK